MLASPGHSPRHIEPPSPSPSVRSDGATTSSGRLLMGPPPPKRRRASQVLDEDTYVAGINRILERDYFPDIPKLQNKLEWLEAERSGDPVLMREAQLNIMQRLKGMGATPGSFGTPGSVMQSPGQFSLDGQVEDELVDEKGVQVGTSVSLDRFMRRYTSEDNESFSNVMEKVNKRRREKYDYLELAAVSPQLRLTDKDRQTDGYGTSNQPVSTLDTWSYKAKNLLMYNPTSDAPLTEAEKEERLHGPPKSINIRSTRFHEKIFDSKVPEEDAVTVLCTPANHGMATPMNQRRYDLDQLRRTPGASANPPPKPGTAGYSFVSTPSPAPGVDSSPFVTWGEIEGTPLRLETEETPVGIGGSVDGPRFKIAAPPPRDTRAHSLAREAGRNIRERSRVRQSPIPPSPSRGGCFGGGLSASPRIGLSPAGQRLAEKTIARRCGAVDVTLRASYGASVTPGTPRMARNAVRGREGSLPPPSPRVPRSPSLG